MIHPIARMALSALSAVVIVALVAGAAGVLRRPDSDGTGGVLTDDDRRALAATQPLRGAEPSRADPAVDLDDPTAVARAYLVAAHSVRPSDAGHTQRRAAPYAQPGSPAAAVGVVVLDPPPPGGSRTADVLRLEPVGADGDRLGYRATVHVASGPHTDALARLLVVLARQPDGRWLVVAESADDPDLSGED